MFARERGVLVAVVDIQSGTWKMAREVFEVLQKEINSKRKTVNEINIKAIQEVATDIRAIVKYTSDIRGKTAKIHTLTDKIDEDVDEIKTAVSNYQNKLKAAVVGIENDAVHVTQQVKSNMLDMR
jgi:predicted  nucleic acid-binding Zn-ribbon protein